MYDGLPETCLTLLPSTGQLIIIKRGEPGYYRTDLDTGNAAQNRELADYHNGHRGITRAQEEAMLVGSMHGFDVPGADPENPLTKLAAESRKRHRAEER